MLPTSCATTRAFGFTLSFFIISARCFGESRFPFFSFVAESLMPSFFAIALTVVGLVFPSCFATASPFGLALSASTICARFSFGIILGILELKRGVRLITRLLSNHLKQFRIHGHAPRCVALI